MCEKGERRKAQNATGCPRNGVTEVISNISLVFGARDLKLWINTVYYRTFDNQKMI